MWRRLLASSSGARALGSAIACVAVAPALCDGPASTAPAAAPGAAAVANPALWTRNLRTGDGLIFQAALGVEPEYARERLSNMIIFAGQSNPSLAEELCYELSSTQGGVELSRFADGEVNVRVLDNVRGKDVYILQSTSQPVNENIMELLLLISTMRRASARSITAVIPYYGYKRDVGTVSTLTHQLRAELVEQLDSEVLHGVQLGAEAGSNMMIDAGSPTLGPLVATAAAATPAVAVAGTDPVTDAVFPVAASDIARMLQTVGVDRVIAVDLQPPGQGQVEGFFGSTPVENLRTTSLAVDYIAKLKLSRPVVVSPNEACIQLAGDFATGMQLRMKVDRVGVAVMVEAGPSRGMDRYVHHWPPRRPGNEPQQRGQDGRREEPSIELVGDVAGCDVVIVDDMIDTGRTLMRRIQLLKDRGARRVIAYATHGLFNGGALARINRSQLSDCVVTNTVPLRNDVERAHTHKIVQLSVAPLVAEAILRVQLGLSLQRLRHVEAAADRGVPAATPRYSGQE